MGNILWGKWPKGGGGGGGARGKVSVLRGRGAVGQNWPIFGGVENWKPRCQIYRGWHL